MWTSFDYMYRDASNFKAFGTVILQGSVSAADQEIVKDRLCGSEFFIAEQVAVPPLCSELYRWSDGPTVSDHCWHEFVGFREIKSLPNESGPVFPASEFIGRLTSVDSWAEELSPHFLLGA